MKAEQTEHRAGVEGRGHVDSYTNWRLLRRSVRGQFDFYPAYKQQQRADDREAGRAEKGEQRRAKGERAMPSKTESRAKE